MKKILFYKDEENHVVVIMNGNLILASRTCDRLLNITANRCKQTIVVETGAEWEHIEALRDVVHVLKSEGAIMGEDFAFKTNGEKSQIKIWPVKYNARMAEEEMKKQAAFNKKYEVSVWDIDDSDEDEPVTLHAASMEDVFYKVERYLAREPEEINWRRTGRSLVSGSNAEGFIGETLIARVRYSKDFIDWERKSR